MWPRPPVTITTGTLRQIQRRLDGTDRHRARRFRRIAARREAPRVGSRAPAASSATSMPATRAIGIHVDVSHAQARMLLRHHLCRPGARMLAAGRVASSSCTRAAPRATSSIGSGRSVAWVLRAWARRSGPSSVTRGGRIEIGRSRWRGAPAVDDARQPVARRAHVMGAGG